MHFLYRPILLRHSRWLLIIVGWLALLPSDIVWAQTGPGGVGNGTGSAGQPRNVVWLDAASLRLSDGDPVGTWPDRSGNGQDATQSAAPRQPLFTAGILNNRPVLRFDGIDNTTNGDKLNLNASINTNGSGIINRDYSVITVAARRTTGNDDGWVLYGSAGANINNLYFGWRGFTNSEFRFSQFGGGNNEVRVAASNYSNSGVNQFAIFTGTLGQAQSPPRNLYENGNFIGSTTGGTPLGSWNGAALGRSFNSSDHSSVDIAEVIFYQGALNEVQRTLIHNYLGAKYSFLVANDHYFGDLTTNGDFDYDVAGIGQQNGQRHTKANSTSLVIAANSSLDANGEFLIVGHDNTPHGTATTALPTGVQERWARSWYVDKTGILGATLQFDLFEAHPSRMFSDEANNYVLLRKTGSTYEEVVVTSKAYNLEHSRISFEIDDAQLIDGEYTLGTTDAAITPLAGFQQDTREFCEYRANFNDGQLPSFLEEGSFDPSRPTTITYANGYAEWENTGGSNGRRKYIRTKDATLFTKSLIFEVTARTPSTSGFEAVTTPFVGLGSGNHAGGYSEPENPSITMSVRLDNHLKKLYFRSKRANGSTIDAGEKKYADVMDKVFRFRITWNADTQQALLEFDYEYTGTFVADAYRVFDGNTNGFDPTNMAVFFGGGNKIVFDDFLLRVDCDTDNDGVNNMADIDSDNDGIIDEDECLPTEQSLSVGSVLSNSFINRNLTAYELNAVQGEDIATFFNADDSFSPTTCATPGDVAAGITNEFIVRGYEVIVPECVQSVQIEMEWTVEKKSGRNGSGLDGGIIVLDAENGEIMRPFTKNIKNTNLNSPETTQYTLNFNTSGEVSRVLIVPALQSQDDGGGTPSQGIYRWLSNITFTTTVTSVNDETCYVYSCNPDIDGDGIPNRLDLDSDNDGVPDNVEAQTTLGYAAPSTDNNNNGLADNYEGSPMGLTPVDTDNDGTPDYHDADSDNDGTPDYQEVGGDYGNNVGNNGLSNFWEITDDYSDVDGILTGAPLTDFADDDQDATSGGDVNFRDPFSDTDRDAQSNTVDLDNDNDGIPDSDECASSQATITLTTEDVRNSINTSTTVGNGQGGQQGGRLEVSSNAVGETSGTIKIKYRAQIINPDNSEATPCQMSFRIGEFDDGLRLEIGNNLVFNFNQVHWERVCEFAPGALFDSDGGPPSGNVGWTPWTGEGDPELIVTSDYIRLMVDTNVPGERRDIIPYLDKTKGTGSDAFFYDRSTNFTCGDSNGTGFLLSNSNYATATRLRNVTATASTYVCNDSDGDGVANMYDLDSDNDGIYDVVESGSGVAHTDGLPNGPINAFGMPQSVDGNNDGVIDYTLVNSDATGEADFLVLDADGDGCSDANEAYEDINADGGDTGVYGTDPATVDTRGRIDGISYTPTAVGNTKIVGPDSDGDGLIDGCDPVFDDHDNDGIGDGYDLDDDNDGITDAIENNPYFPISGFASYWPQNNSTDDASINNHDATTGIVGFSTDNVRGGASASFNGTDQSLTYSNSGTGYLRASHQNLTYSFWVKPGDFDGNQILVEHGGTSAGFVVDLVGQDIRLGIRQGSGSANLFVAPLVLFPQDGAWHHLAAVYSNDGTLKLYLDAKEVATVTKNPGPLESSNNHQAFGGSESGDIHGYGGKHYFGLMDEILHYQQALTPADIVGLYEAKNDSDNDGIYDQFDLDSDNDGIYDVVESGSGAAHADGMVTGPVGANGFDDSLETGVDSGTPNYTLADSDADTFFDYLVLDADGDGCNDVTEAGFDDPDSDGLLGSGSPSVDAEGRVTGGSYAAPSDGDTNGTFDFQEAGSAPSASIATTAMPVCPNTDDILLYPTTGSPNFTYQWEVSEDGVSYVDVINDALHQGAQSDTLRVSSNAVLNGNQYRVVITNTSFVCGTATSDVATIEIRESPNAGGDGTLTICDATQPVNLFDGIVGPHNTTGRWQNNSSVTVDLSNPEQVVFDQLGGGPFVFTYVVDATAICSADSSTVQVALDPTCFSVVATPVQVTVDEDSTITTNVLVNDSGVNGGDLTALLVTPPTNGTATLTPDGELVYVPNENFHGTDTLIYRVCDKTAPTMCDTARVVITINPVNDAPVAVNDAAIITYDETATGNVLDNDYDPDGGPLGEVSSISPPTHGEVVLNPDGTYVYTPDPYYMGPDQFSYWVCDAQDPDLCAKAEVIIQVRAGLVEIPKGFSPNSDGNNDRWEIKGIAAYPNNSVTILNRWGNAVYRGQGYDNQQVVWDGTANQGLIVGGGQLPEGTYFYVVDLGPEEGPQSGYVVLMR